MFARRTVIKLAAVAPFNGIAKSPAILQRKREVVIGVHSSDAVGEQWNKLIQYIHVVQRTCNYSFQFQIVAIDDRCKSLMKGELDAYLGFASENSILHTAYELLGNISASTARDLAFSQCSLSGSRENFLDQLGNKVDLKLLILGHTGQSLGLWSKKPLGPLANLKDHTIAARGLTCRIIERLGAVSIENCSNPADALTQGDILAAEWGTGPECLSAGLSQAARYCSKQAISDAGQVISLTFSLKSWHSLNSIERHSLQTSAQAGLLHSPEQSVASKNAFVTAFRDTHGTIFYDLNPDVIRKIADIKRDILEELASVDALSQRIFQQLLAIQT